MPYDPGWPAAFDAEAVRLRGALGALALRIDHNGSTSIPGLAAKPVIDIQVSVAALQPIEAYGERLEAIGYVHVPHPDDSFCPFFHRPLQWPHGHHVHVAQMIQSRAARVAVGASRRGIEQTEGVAASHTFLRRLSLYK